jgi:hypothetical protein
VQGVKNPDMRSYRAVVAGLDAFEEQRALAPLVPALRFRLAPQRGQAAPEGEPLYLRIVGNGEPIPVPVAPDGTFSVPRVQSAIDDDADLILNRKKGVLKGRPDIRTPGLPDHVRRLGDLRLECQVMVAIAKEELGLMLKLFINTVAMTTDWCNMKVNGKRVGLAFSSLRALDGAEIVDGERRAPLVVHDFSFKAPLADTEWSNEARIELRYAPELTAEERADPWLQTIYVIGSMSDWASRHALRQVEQGVCSTQLELGKGLHAMKIGTRGLAALELGAPGPGDHIVEDTAAPLAMRGKRLKLEVKAAGRYAITLDARDRDAPTLRVTRLSQDSAEAPSSAPAPAPSSAAGATAH